MQKLAWERHGFRAANFAGTDSISRFGVAGTLDQIPAVSELPNNDAMQHLITTLQPAQAKLVADISMYDTMYTQNAQQYRELKMTVLAGKKALADFNANQLPALEAEAAASGDAMQAQVLKNFKSKLDRFAKRLDDLDRISVVTLQTAPQIKIIQNADQTIVDKIDTTISTTIPVWKSQMVIALGLSNQRKVLDLQNKADDVTNKLLARNAAALHKGAEGRQGQPRGRPGQDAPNRVRPQKRLARKRPADVSRSRASMLPLAEFAGTCNHAPVGRGI